MRYTEINSGKHPENTFPGSIQTREIENEVERMRKRKWRILSLLLVAVMTLGILFGCSKDGGEKGSGGKATPVSAGNQKQLISNKPRERAA